MATHSNILAWKILWMEKPGRLQSMGLLRVRHDWVTFTFTFWILSITLIACEMSAIVWFGHFLALPFFGIGMKTDIFQPCGHCWVFQIYWHSECSTLLASSFRIWNSSTGMPSPLLALFIVMLPKAHLTSHSRMSGSRLVITPSWLSGSWRSFLYSSSVYSCHLIFCFCKTPHLEGNTGTEPWSF